MIFCNNNKSNCFF